MGARFGHRVSFCAIGSVALVLALSEPARAASDIPAECGSRALFDAELRQRLGRATSLDDVQVRIAQQGERFHLRVQIGDDVRELDDPSCTELFRAAVVVALAVLMHDERRQPAPPAPAPVPAPPGRREHPFFAASAGAGFVAGSLPKPVLGLELEAKVLWRHLGAALDLRYLAAAEERDTRDKGVLIQGLSLGAAGLFRPAPRWEARLGLAAQRFAGRGRGSIAQPQTDVSWAAGPTLGLGFVPLQTPSWCLGLGAEGQLNALRARFQIRNYSEQISDEAQDVFTSPWLAASGFVRLGLLF